VQPEITGQFRVECESEMVTLSHRHYPIIVLGDDLDPGAGCLYERCPDENAPV
jgi:hypothetical protein